MIMLKLTGGDEAAMPRSVNFSTLSRFLHIVLKLSCPFARW